MNVGSLFSGIGGLDLGLARAGHRHVFFCESDPYRRDVLRQRWPGVPVYDDVRTLGEPAWRAPVDGAGAPVDGGRWEAGTGLPVRGDRSITNELDERRSGSRWEGRSDLGCGRGAVDLLCGGFPCQDLSVAGRRAGLDGARSGLFFEFARIAESLRPGWILVENVPGLLSSNGGRDFGVVLGTLADLGYGVAWRVLDSRFFGVPQRRRRVFIVGALADGDTRAAAERAGEVLAVGKSCGRHPKTRRQEGEELAGSLGGSVGKGRGNDGNPFDRGGHSSLSGLGSGGPDDNDAQAGRLVVDLLGSDQYDGDDVVGPLALEGVGSRERGLSGVELVSGVVQHGSVETDHVRHGDSPSVGDSADSAKPAPPVKSIVAFIPEVAGTLKSDKGRGWPVDAEMSDKIVAFHPTGGGAKGLSESEDVAPGTGTGTGGTVAVAFTTRGRDGEAATEAQTDGLHPALRAARGGGRRDSGVAGPEIGVRRLTPVECERLQGLPDGWTDLGGTADSKRYSALGDAVTVNVAEWIGRRLAA